MPTREEPQENYPQDKFLILRSDILSHKELTDSEKIVYARICSFSRYFESSANCAEILGKTERVVADAKRKLEKFGFIKCIENTGRGKVYIAIYDTFDGNPDDGTSDLRKNVHQTYEKTYIRPTKKCTSDLRKNVDIDKRLEKREEESIVERNNSYVAPAMQEPLPQEALELADLLKEKILKNQPTAKIDKNYQKNWAKDIEKAHRIDGRSWNQLRGAITYAQDYSDFWGMNIRSGAKLRKHYDRLEADLRRLYNQRGIMIAGKPQNGSEGAENEFNVPF